MVLTSDFCFSSFFIGVQMREEDILVSVLDDDDRVYWYHFELLDVGLFVIGKKID